MIIFFKICYGDFILLLLRNKIIINVNYLYGLILFNLCLREVKNGCCFIFKYIKLVIYFFGIFVYVIYFCYVFFVLV